MRNYYLRNSVTLGTSFTALFLLVHCTVEEPDYSLLNIAGNAGSGASGSGGGGGTGGSGGDGTSGASAGQGGLAGLGGLGGMGGQGGTPVEPVPCDPVINDAGLTDAGLTDAGPNDAGPSDPCACVDGFIQAVDADGDGVGTRACSVAPGLDCDDGDEAVTHNSCNGCTDLPNAIGADCLDCGAYACDGPDAVVCASKPDPLVDPDCQCVDGVIAARDTDQDGEGTRLCEQNPGVDCNDGDNSFVTNQCGGCDTLPGTDGADCNECGAWTCSGTALVCEPKTGAGGRRCLDGNTRQTCVGTGFFSLNTDCTGGTNVCYQGTCVVCAPGTFRCVPWGASTQVERCNAGGTDWSSFLSCTPAQTCNAGNGTCTSHLLLPRDRAFDVVPLRRGGLPWHDILNTASDSDYG